MIFFMLIFTKKCFVLKYKVISLHRKNKEHYILYTHESFLEKEFHLVPHHTDVCNIHTSSFFAD